MPQQLLPDVEKALILGLLDDSDLVALVATRISTDLGKVFPMQRVLRVGGPSGRRLDEPLIYLDSYGDVPDKRPAGEKEQLREIAAATVRAIWQLQGAVIHSICTITAVNVLTTLQWLPDPLTQQGRYHSVVRLYTTAPR